MADTVLKSIPGLTISRGPSGISVVSVLQAIQERYNYLPEELLKNVAEELNVPLIDIYSVATFYKSFSLVPRGKHMIVTCMGTACHVRGSDGVTEEISRLLKVDRDSTSKDGEYTIECVNCLGACALAPLVIVDGQFYGNMTPAKIHRLFRTEFGINSTYPAKEEITEVKAGASAGTFANSSAVQTGINCCCKGE